MPRQILQLYVYSVKKNLNEFKIKAIISFIKKATKNKKKDILLGFFALERRMLANKN